MKKLVGLIVIAGCSRGVDRQAFAPTPAASALFDEIVAIDVGKKPMVQLADQYANLHFELEDGQRILAGGEPIPPEEPRNATFLGFERLKAGGSWPAPAASTEGMIDGSDPTLLALGSQVEKMRSEAALEFESSEAEADALTRYRSNYAMAASIRFLGVVETLDTKGIYWTGVVHLYDLQDDRWRGSQFVTASSSSEPMNVYSVAPDGSRTLVGFDGGPANIQEDSVVRAVRRNMETWRYLIRDLEIWEKRRGTRATP